MYCPLCDQSLSVRRNAFCPHCSGALKWHGGFPLARTVRSPRSSVRFWLIVWCGTVAAGGLFGLFYSGPVGLVVGFIIAGMFGIPIVATTAVLSWVFWLSRFRISVACLAGSSTGLVAALSLFGTNPFGGSRALSVPLIAGILGMAGSGLSAALYSHRNPVRKNTQQASLARWQFSLRDLFLRMTVVSVLFAAWLALFRVLGT